MNIFDKVERFDIDTTKLTSEEKNILIANKIMESDINRINITKTTFLKYNLSEDYIPEDAIIEVDEDVLEKELSSIIDNYPYYLIVSEFYKDGYKFCNNKIDIVKRNFGEYLTFFEPTDNIRHKGVVANEAFIENQIKTAYIIGMTSDEFNRVTEEDVQNFMKNPYLTEVIS